MISERTLNNIVIKPLIVIENKDESKVKGGKLFYGKISKGKKKQAGTDLEIPKRY